MSYNNVSSRTVVTLVIVGIVLVAGGFLIAQLTPSLVPVGASAEAQQVDSLLRVLLVVGGAIFLLVQGLLVYSIWRFRAKPGDRSDGIDLHGNTTLEIVWTAIPAVIVFVLTILSYQVWTSIHSVKPNEMMVEATGARFNWAFTYATDTADPRSAGQNISITAKELHVYVGQPVVLRMQTRDVIHSFWVPAFRVKQDLIPGRVTEVRFTPIDTGGQYPVTYPIKCTELCGAAHGEMIATVVVHRDEADYLAWLGGEVDKVLNPPADPVVRGRDILASQVYPCHTCHVESDLGWVGNVGPTLNGIADRAATSRANATGQSPADYLYASIHDPGSYLVPGFGNLMPQLNIPECDTWAIVAYLATQSDSGAAPFEVVQPDECVVTGSPAEATAEPGAEATPEAAAEATPEAAPAEATAEATLDAAPGS